MLINAKTSLIGIIGNPLGHSLSPMMHNYTLDKMDLNYVYLPFEVTPERLGEALDGIKALNLSGVNVTIPYKTAVIPYLDELSPEALACGAVNVIKNQNGRLIGYNTDGRGFMASLAEEGIDSITKVLLLGAGGAARSLAYELTMSGVDHIDILDLDQGKACELARFVGKLPGGRAEGAQMSAELFAGISQIVDLIVNCTPVGMHPNIKDTPVINLNNVPADTVVYDLIYNPMTTRFLSIAQAKGLKTMNGLSMLVHQGAITLQILTGVLPPIACMKEVVLNS